ncbi:MAG TPA: cupin domain-containing protein [Burkholderiales bacterium]|nr:cupin domain-containing protein [Burkholderiales bacterium]
MTVQAHAEAERVESGTSYARRARYLTSENPFTFEWPPVPVRQFLAERDRAFDPSTPSGEIVLDASGELGTRYPATTPTLLVRYVKIRAGERIRTAFAASGEIYYAMTGEGESRNGTDSIEWGAGDVYSFPGGGETVHRAGRTDCLLFVATNEPLLGFERLRPPAPGQAAAETVHWPAEEIERRFEAVWQRPTSDKATGRSVMFSTLALAPSYMTIPTINAAINTLDPGGDQRPHRHNGVAITLAIQGDGIYSMIDGQRVDWSTGAAQITPATTLHSHHNRGAKRMRSLVIQDEGLHHYTRTPGFSFD